MKHFAQSRILTDKNYPEALKILQRIILSAHINELLNIKTVERDRDLQGLHRLYDIESHVCSLRRLDVDDDNYGSLLTTIIMEELACQLKLMISRHVGDDTWNLTQLLCLIWDEIKAGENCLTPDNLFIRNAQDSYKGGKNLILHIQVQVYMFLNKLQK